jgi:hypothetical protein
MTEDEMVSEIFAVLRTLVHCIDSAHNETNEVDVSVVFSARNRRIYDLPIPPHAIPAVLKVVGLEILRDFRKSEKFRERCSKDLIDKIDAAFSLFQNSAAN